MWFYEHPVKHTLHPFPPTCISYHFHGCDLLPDKIQLNGERHCFGLVWGDIVPPDGEGMDGIRSVRWLITLHLHQEVESRPEESSSHTHSNSLPPIRLYLEAWLLAGDQVFQHRNVWGIFHIQTTSPSLFASVPVPHLVCSLPFAPAALWSGDTLFWGSTHQWEGVFLVPFWIVCLSS